MSTKAGTVNHICRPECIPDSDTPPRVGTGLYVLRRVSFAATHVVAIVFGLFTAVLNQKASRRLLGLWARSVLRAAGITVEFDGVAEHPGAKLMVANHVSFFDPMAMWARLPHLVGVVTHRAQSNPVIARLTRNSGTIYVDGTTRSAVPGMVRDVTAALNAGNGVFAAPEGCIRCHAPGGPFPPAVLQAAINADVVVQPMLLRCVLRDGTPTAHGAAFPVKEDLGSMLRRVLRLRGLRIRITLFPVLDAGAARDRRELASLAKQPLDDTTGPLPDTCVGVTTAEPTRTRVRSPVEKRRE